MDQQLVRGIIAEVLQGYRASSSPAIPVELSARHVHLCQQHVEQLFGSGYQLTPSRDLSQPGQFLCKERVRLVGPKGAIDNVAVLGPARGGTQVELAAADGRQLGIKPPLRMSGDTSGAADLVIFAGERFVHAQQSAIIARNHIHMTPADAGTYGVADGEAVRVRIDSERPITFEHVTVRVDPSFSLAMHIDTDEGNACGWSCGVTGTIVRSPFEAQAPAPAIGQPIPVQVAAQPNTLDWDGKLIAGREAEALRGLGKTEVHIPCGTILTPLAKDVLREAKIKITFVEAGEAV